MSNLKKAIQATDIHQLLDYFGVRYIKRSGRTMLLCPNPRHSDHRMGSCVLFPDGSGYYCFACGEKRTKWEIATQDFGMAQKDACELFYNLSGVPDGSFQKEDSEIFAIKKKIAESGISTDPSSSSYLANNPMLTKMVIGNVKQNKAWDF